MFARNDCKRTGLATLLATLLSIATSVAAEEQLDASELVERMSAEIASLDAFMVNGDAYADARMDAGQIIEHSSQVTLKLRRKPSAIRISNRSAEDTKEIYFDDGAVNVYSTAENFYAEAEIPQGVDSMLEFVVDDIGIESPMLDLIAADVADHLLEDMESISYLGTSLIRDKVYHHVGIRYPETDGPRSGSRARDRRCPGSWRSPPSGRVARRGSLPFSRGTRILNSRRTLLHLSRRTVLCRSISPTE